MKTKPTVQNVSGAIALVTETTNASRADMPLKASNSNELKNPLPTPAPLTKGQTLCDCSTESSLSAEQTLWLKRVAITHPSQVDTDQRLTEIQRFRLKKQELDNARYQLHIQQLAAMEDGLPVPQEPPLTVEQMNALAELERQEQAKRPQKTWAQRVNEISPLERIKMASTPGNFISDHVLEELSKLSQTERKFINLITLRPCVAFYPQRLNSWIEDEKANIPALSEICKRFNLNPEKDSELAREILTAGKDIAQCLECDGVHCRKAENSSAPKFEQMVIREDPTGKPYIVKITCKVGVSQQNYFFGKKSGIPKQYVGKTFYDFDVDDDNMEAVELAKLFRLEPQGLYLFGECGCGKTFLASLIAQECIASGKTVCFGEVPVLLADIKKTFNRQTTDAPTEEQITSKYINCDVLFLDDIGTGTMSDWAVNILYTIINERYNEKRTIILTSNYDFDGLIKRLAKGDPMSAKRIVSRLAAMCKPIYMGDRDRRLLPT